MGDDPDVEKRKNRRLNLILDNFKEDMANSPRDPLTVSGGPISGIDNLFPPLTLKHYQAVQDVWMVVREICEERANGRLDNPLNDLEICKCFGNYVCESGEILPDEYKINYFRKYVFPLISKEESRKKLSPEQRKFAEEELSWMKEHQRSLAPSH